MTIEQAIAYLKIDRAEHEAEGWDNIVEAIDVAIEALEKLETAEIDCQGLVNDWKAHRRDD